MRKFLYKFIIFVSPIIIVLLPYVVTDPFKVIWGYETYTPKDGEPMYINLNRTMVSTEMFIKNHPIYNYDSYIFGSSRSMVYRINDWEKYLPEDASCFHFDGYGESLYLIHKKITYLDDKATIRNVLLPIDYNLLYQTKPFYTPLHIEHPALNNYNNRFLFQSTFVRSYLNKTFLPNYIYYLATDSITPYMVETGIIDTVPYCFKEKYNEYGCDGANRSVDKKQFYERSSQQEYYPKVINEEQKKLLQEIKEIFDKHSTQYYIIINPMFDQKKLDTNDIKYLDSLFNKRVFDFSGINKLTNNISNYSDVAHFIPDVAKIIIDSIYVTIR